MNSQRPWIYHRGSESDQYNKGVRFISQRGRDGTQHVVAEQTSVNGSVISTVPWK